MKKQIYQSTIFGTITAPASKSLMQRALTAALLSKEEIFLHNAGFSNDDIVTLRIIQYLGAEVTTLDDGTLRIKSFFKPHLPEPYPFKGLKIIQCGESGLAARMFTPIAGLIDQRVVLEGEGGLLRRQLGIPEEIFKDMKVKFGSRSGRIPFRIRGPLVPVNIEVDCSATSQFLTGLLFAYSYAGAEDVTISLKNLKSSPYIDLTLAVMHDFGMTVPVNDNYQKLYFPKNTDANRSKPKLGTLHYTVESDWSNAAMMLVAGATAGEVTIKGLDLNSYQGDKIILEVLKQVGCDLTVTDEQIFVRKNQLNAFHFNAEHFPDLFPPLVALAANCKGTSVIEGIQRLKYKESNRAVSLQYEFGRLGIKINFEDDKMLIEGGQISGGKVKSHNDHRVAMALTIAGLNAISRVEVGDAEAVDKSYPYFYSDLNVLGAKIETSLR